MKGQTRRVKQGASKRSCKYEIHLILTDPTWILKYKTVMEGKGSI